MALLSKLWFEERDEAQEFHQSTVSADFDLIKFDAGNLALGMTWVELPDLLIVWARAKGAARWLAQHSNGCPNFFFAFETEQQFWGREMPPTHAVFGNASGIRDGAFRNGCTTLDVTVSSELSDKLGWTVYQDEVLETDPKSLMNLRMLCHLVTMRSEQLTSSGVMTWPAGEADRWQGLIVEALECAAVPWLTRDERWRENGHSIPNHHRIVLDAEAFLHEHVASGAVAVADLADHLGVAERSLYHGFRRSLGLGPRRYLELLRLHEFRRRLRSGDRATTKVLTIAHGLGFSEFGHLAKKYEEQFGELPSETLRGR